MSDNTSLLAIIEQRLDEIVTLCREHGVAMTPRGSQRPGGRCHARPRRA
jgi:hypothetical protein